MYDVPYHFTRYPIEGLLQVEEGDDFCALTFVSPLANEANGELEREVQAWCDRLERFGPELNVKKTEYLTTDVTESIKANGIELPRTSIL
ncbi:unnamed protein product [Heligmosomoides polygyrus]|uniref:Reverse transcriptase domain-containing protein n=1 Tax=Heligmosomoides polygyrus TaxID=6339 RepID=A0A183FED5_HELPZ|nr:unnamed protein product [Heligmosomoides polygyrus]